MKKRSSESERSYTEKQTIKKLQRVIRCLQKNEAFVIQIAGKRLRVPANVKLNIAHEQDGKQQEVEFQFVW